MGTKCTDNGNKVGRQHPFCTSRRVISCILGIWKLVFPLLLKAFVMTLGRVLLKRFWFYGNWTMNSKVPGCYSLAKTFWKLNLLPQKGIQLWVTFEKAAFGDAELSPASSLHYMFWSREILNIATKYLK